MGEGGSRFEGYEAGRHRRTESDPNTELKENLELLNKLLARLIEKGGDLSPQVKKGLRGQIQGLLQLLGVKSLDDHEGFTKLYEKLNDNIFNLPSPSGYPDSDQINNRLEKIYGEKSRKLPTVSRNPVASDLARYAQSDWKEIEGRGGVGLIDYIAGLGKVMSSEHAYTTIFEENDTIGVVSDWQIENGRHRALTLRILGPKYVEEKKMDKWVEVQKEN